MLEISHNSTSIGKGCWMKYYWTYVVGIQPQRKSKAFYLGGVIHKAFEQYYTGTSNEDVLKYISSSYDKAIEDTTVEEEEALIIDKHTAIGMWAYYPHKDLSEFQENYPELSFVTKIPGKRNVRFVGRVDGLVKKNGNWWVREVKTTGLSPRQFEGRMATSAQATGYVFALRQQGFDVKGVMYDTIKKPLLRKRQNESCQDFGQRIIEDYKLDSKKPEGERKAYLRHDEYRVPYQIDQWIETQQGLIDDIRHKQKTNGWFRNMDQCWNWNTLCPFAKVCHMEKPDKLTLEMFYEERTKH